MWLWLLSAGAPNAEINDIKQGNFAMRCRSLGELKTLKVCLSPKQEVSQKQNKCKALPDCAKPDMFMNLVFATARLGRQ